MVQIKIQGIVEDEEKGMFVLAKLPANLPSVLLPASERCSPRCPPRCPPRHTPFAATDFNKNDTKSYLLQESHQGLFAQRGGHIFGVKSNIRARILRSPSRRHAPYLATPLPPIAYFYFILHSIPTNVEKDPLL